MALAFSKSRFNKKTNHQPPWEGMADRTNDGGKEGLEDRENFSGRETALDEVHKLSGSGDRERHNGGGKDQSCPPICYEEALVRSGFYSP